ncbi:hypothetical protein ZIOFF_030764 [Zingiber officinale]|uniref:non-specific serine/threonine protein kinase n=1 Tax=Zingiber officinale TaxID=94328 RepID=A0A8J5LBZ9_ZINOF|nr:hypothetical protein ZIOFF_030764 [Zingiber officinale]
MGHSSKKKKKRSGGGRGRGWASSKDSSCAAVVDENLLADELTVLNSIFQDDFKIISEPPHASFSIKLRPYSSDMGYDDLYVSASLLVRCLPGYPYKCPKLQIMPERGLLKEDADRLLVLLLDQAKVNAQEGRVMIFNLVEAAQEFLSEITPLSESHESIPYVSSSIKSEEATSQFDTYCYSDGSSVYSLVDLYSDLCGNDVTLSHVKKAMNGNSSKTFKIEVRQANLNNNNIYLDSHTSANPEIPVRDDSLLQNRKYEAINLIKHGDSLSASKLNVVAEEGDNDTTSSSPKATSIPMSPDTLQNINDSTKHEDMNLREQVAENDNFGSDDLFSSSSSYVSVTSDNDSQSRGKDLLLIHLLRIACSSKESLTNVLPEISLELRKIGVLSEWARDLVAAPSSEFTEAFNNAFGRQVASSRFSEFWRMDSSSSKSTSRYLSDFEEVRSLGRGAFGHVALCRNKLDGRQYALKKICLKDENLHVNEKILRTGGEQWGGELLRAGGKHKEMELLKAWLETEYGNNNFDSAAGSRITESFSHSYLGDFNVENRNQSTYLYIQMEYCPRTLREDFDSYSSSSDKEYAWHLFRQIVEGLAHIHSQGIIHRDLTPSNIFFDVRNEIKIGDFGLEKYCSSTAKFLQLEQLDHDQHFPAEMTGMSTDGTGRVGTYFYTAPEVEMSWPQINEKADMYSLGVIFFELWHPFATAMERHIVLSDLKQKSLVPPSWAAKFPREATLLQRLISLSPSDRPSATELLQHELPPRLEDEWLNVSKEIFRQHCAKRFDISPLRILDESSTFNRLQLADLRFCGPADQALARLRGALSPDKSTLQALEDMSALLRYLRFWNIEQNISIDVLMPPTETYYQSLFFQRSVSPGAVGVSFALEKILLLSSVEIMPSRYEPNTHVLVCSRGGGGLLQERMELVAEFWEANIKAEFLPQKDPSFKEQYEYASENDIKCLVIITEAGLSQGSLVKSASTTTQLSCMHKAPPRPNHLCTLDTTPHEALLSTLAHVY